MARIADWQQHFIDHPDIADAIIAPHPGRDVQRQVAADIDRFVDAQWSGHQGPVRRSQGFVHI